jgi:hypothetical protein
MARAEKFMIWLKPNGAISIVTVDVLVPVGFVAVIITI